MAKMQRFGPVALTNTYTTDILKPPTTTGGTNAGTPTPFIVLYNIHVTNKGASPATFRLYIGASVTNSAGTEVAYDYPVPVGGCVDLNGPFVLESTDVLVGGASAGTTLTIEMMGTIGIR